MPELGIISIAFGFSFFGGPCQFFLQDMCLCIFCMLQALLRDMTGRRSRILQEENKYVPFPCSSKEKKKKTFIEKKISKERKKRKRHLYTEDFSDRES